MEKKLVITAVVVSAIVVVAAVSASVILSRGTKTTGVVYYVNLAPKDMKASLTAGDISGYIAWEPYVSDSVAAGVGTVLEWSSQIVPGHPCCVIAVSPSFLEGSNGVELTERFLKADIEANQWMAEALAHPGSKNYTLLVNMAMGFTARNATVVQEAFKHIEYGYGMNQGFMSNLEQFTNMYIDINMTSSANLQRIGYSSVNDFVSHFVNGTFLNAAASVAPSNTMLNPGNPIRLGYLLGDLHEIAQVVAQNTTVGGGKSLFEKYGLYVKNAAGAPYANGGYEMTLGFAARNVDIGYLGAAPAILNRINADVRVIVVAQANSEGSGIVVGVNSGITSLSGLENKTIATPGESTIQFLLLTMALKKVGLELKLKT